MDPVHRMPISPGMAIPSIDAQVPRPARTEPASLAGLFSCGRSGSTWLGALLGTHPRVAYRFEPRRSSAGIARETVEAIDRLASPQIDDRDLAAIRHGLLTSDPYSDKPPFSPRARGTMRLQSMRSLLWPLARKLPRLTPAWRALFTPRRCDTVIFKMVAHERECRTILARTSMPIIYLVRHPFGMIASLLDGQQAGLMPSGRASVIHQFMLDNAPDLHRRFGARISGMGPHQHEALLWRWSVETSVEDLAGADPARLLVVFYENACRAIGDEMPRLLGFLGLPPDDQVDRFVRESADPDARGLRETGINPYFSVFRNPLETMEKWRKRLGRTEQDEILEIVRDSPIFRQGVAKAAWWDRSTAS